MGMKHSGKNIKKLLHTKCVREQDAVENMWDWETGSDRRRENSI